MKLEGLRVDFVAGTLAIGGTERQLYYIVKVLSEAGARTRVLTLTCGGAYQKDIGRLGIPVIYVGRSPLKIIRLCNIISELKKDPPQIIHSMHLYTNLYAAIAARIVGTKELGSIRNSPGYEITKLPLYGKWCLSYPRFLIANSRQAIKDAVAAGVKPESISLLDNVVDTERFKPGPNKKELLTGPDSTVGIICAGRLTEEKRIDLFLNVLSEVYRLAPYIRARIIGKGPLRKSLEDLARRLGLGPDIVEFTGEVEDMPSFYQQADILVFTSGFEGMPNVVLEAMACGLPVLTTNAGAVSDVVNHGLTGYVVSVGDTNGLIQYLLDLVRSSNLRQEMGRQARAVVENRFSLERLQQKLFELYSRIVTS